MFFENMELFTDLDLNLNIFQNHKYRLNNKDKNNNILTITSLPTTIFVN